MPDITLRFGIENQVPGATLTSNVAPQAATPLDWLKYEWRARKVVFTSPASEVVITGQLDTPQVLEFFMLSGIERTSRLEIQFIAYSDGQATSVQEFDSGFIAVNDIPPLGEWRAGIDPYGVEQDGAGPLNYVVWLDTAIVYDKFEVIIREEGGGAPSTFSITTAAAGHKLQFDEDFSYGSEISFLTPPALVQLAAGNFVPARAQRRSRALTLSLEHMTNQDRARLRRMEVGEQGRPFLVSAYPSETGWQYNDYNFLGRFASSLPYAHVHQDMHGTSMTILEA